MMLETNEWLWGYWNMSEVIINYFIKHDGIRKTILKPLNYRVKANRNYSVKSCGKDFLDQQIQTLTDCVLIGNVAYGYSNQRIADRTTSFRRHTGKGAPMSTRWEFQMGLQWRLLHVLFLFSYELIRYLCLKMIKEDNLGDTKNSSTSWCWQSPSWEPQNGTGGHKFS